MRTCSLGISFDILLQKEELLLCMLWKNINEKRYIAYPSSSSSSPSSPICNNLEIGVYHQLFPSSALFAFPHAKLPSSKQRLSFSACLEQCASLALDTTNCTVLCSAAGKTQQHLAQHLESPSLFFRAHGTTRTGTYASKHAVDS